MQFILRRGLLAITFVMASGFITIASAADMVVSDVWSRASIGTKRPGVVYMTIHNSGQNTETLIGLHTDRAMMSEIHQSSTNDQGVSSMLPAGKIEIAAGETIALEPGGLHAMLMHLTRPMIEGERFFLTLSFADGDEVTIEVPILGFSARGPEG